MNKRLTWREIKALNDVYVKGTSSARIQQHPYILYLKNDLGLLSKKFAQKNVLLKEEGFDAYYEQHHLMDFQAYQTFLNANNVLTNYSRYDEDDIQVLILVKNNKDEIVKSLTTQRSFSAAFFNDKGSKHLENHPGLEKALLKILGVLNFPDKDPKNNQFRYVVDCKTKQRIVLCENLNFLKSPWVARENNIELWYVGGNNISSLSHLKADEITLPIYYSCDWDFDGLKIFQKIREQIPAIKLLMPQIKNTKSVYSDNHFSKWKKDIEFSGLNKAIFERDAIELVQKLIQQDQWIEEESNDFLQMIELNSL